MPSQVITIPVVDKRGVKSLAFDGANELVDWCGGGRRYRLDGSSGAASVFFAYDFDAAAVSPSRRYVVLYKKLGTKGLVITRDLRVVREIDRSYYFASSYEYPVALIRAADGREVLIHCPRAYNWLEVEDIESGQRLIDDPARRPTDVFHSRLASDPSGRWLLSAGWLWHPLDVVGVYDLHEALARPASLDASPDAVDCGTEVTAAAFRDDRTMFLWADADAEDFAGDDKGEPSLRPGTIAVYDFTARQVLSVAPVGVPVGRLMPVDAEHVVGFHGHPRLIHVPSGRVVEEWLDIVCGVHGSSIIHHLPPAPPVALDPAGKRFAVAAADRIHVVQLA